jgi:hypothetical protein
MNIVKQHQEFKLRLNKVDSNHYQDFKPWQIDSFLNQAALFIVEHWGELFGNNSQVNKDILGNLLIMYPEQVELDTTLVNGNQYEYKLSRLKYKYHHLARAYFQCGENVVPVSMITHDQQHKLNDAFQKPSFKWKRLPALIGKSSDEEEKSLYVYADVDLTKRKIRIEYVKYPVQCFFGGYDTIEYINCQRTGGDNCDQFYSTNSFPVDSDIPESYHDLQVDVAVMLASSKTENVNLFNSIQNKLANLPR